MPAIVALFLRLQLPAPVTGAAATGQSSAPIQFSWKDVRHLLCYIAENYTAARDYAEV